MDKFNRILKNIVVFLAIFLIVDFVFGFFQGDEEQQALNDGNIVFSTTDNEYSRFQTVTLEIENYSDETITLPSQCPEEPLNVYRYENNEWVQKSANPDISCKHAADIVLNPGAKTTIAYKNWNHALFSEMGRFRIEFETEIEGEEKTITSNEFLVVKEGIIRQLGVALFYRPIYNALIFLTYILPEHSLGLAIILLTLLIRTILLIPSQKAMKAQRRMQDIQPKLEEIRKKYKDDQQRIAMETMNLWKEAKVNPAGSCLPLLLQFPFLISLFYVIQGGINPDNSFLLYQEYANFTQANISTYFLGLELTEVNKYVLPLIVGGLQFGQMKLAMAKRQKKSKKKDKDSQPNEMAMANNMMVYILPVMIAVFTASLPSGVGLYWGTSTLYGIIQQVFVNRSSNTNSDKKSGDEPTVKVVSK